MYATYRRAYPCACQAQIAPRALLSGASDVTRAPDAVDRPRVSREDKCLSPTCLLHWRETLRLIKVTKQQHWLRGDAPSKGLVCAHIVGVQPGDLTARRPKKKERKKKEKKADDWNNVGRRASLPGTERRPKRVVHIADRATYRSI
jgi:hypothetical protein